MIGTSGKRTEFRLATKNWGRPTAQEPRFCPKPPYRSTRSTKKCLPGSHRGLPSMRRRTRLRSEQRQPTETCVSRPGRPSWFSPSLRQRYSIEGEFECDDEGMARCGEFCCQVSKARDLFDCPFGVAEVDQFRGKGIHVLES